MVGIPVQRVPVVAESGRNEPPDAQFAAMLLRIPEIELRLLSAEVLKAMESRTAISGLTPARPFRIALSVFRLTPRASAASVTETPRGSRQSSRMISPG
jgi:hypothetical protein